MNSPVVLFTYNRPHHTKKVLDALSENPESQDTELFIYCDGPKPDASALDLEKIKKIHSICESESRFKNVKVTIERQNKGLAKSIVDGVTEIVNRYGRVIVLEDDIITSKHFLKYMNEGLDIYMEDDEVMHISAYTPNIQAELPDTFFYNQTSCWGWATWKEAWSNFSSNSEQLLKEVLSSGRVSELDIDGSYPFSSHLKMNITGELSTWAVKWHASVILNRGLCLHPNKSLVKNVGHDGSGENSTDSNFYDTDLANTEINVVRIKELKENFKARRAVAAFYYSQGSKPRPFSPISFKQNVRLVKEYPSHEISKNYQKSLGINVEKYFEGIPTVRVYECTDTGYKFYYPDCLAGDGVFYEALEQFGWYYDPWKWEHSKVFDQVKEGMKILEIGCAEGSFLEKVKKERHVIASGVELNAKAVNIAQDKGLDVELATIQDFSAKNQNGFDIVCAFQVLEHISNVHSFLDAALKTLKKGGKLIIGVPNNDSFLGLREKDLLNIPPHHMGLWNEKSLRNLCKYFPIEVSRFSYEPLQERHREYFQNTVYEAKRKKLQQNTIKYSILGKLINKFENKNFENKLKKQYPTIENYTVLVEFIKQ